MFNQNQLQQLNAKLNQLLSSSSVVSIGQAPRNISSNQVFNYEGKQVTCLNDCLTGSKLLIFQDSNTGNYFALAEEGSKRSGEILSSRKVLSRQTIPKSKPFTRKPEPQYAILYRREYEEENRLEFWVATENYEKLVHTTELVLTDYFSGDIPEGYYLAIWAKNMYPTESGRFFGETINVSSDNGIYTPVNHHEVPLFPDSWIVLSSSLFTRARLPKPLNLPEPYFTGDYFIPGVDVFNVGFFPTGHTLPTISLGSIPPIEDYPTDGIYRTVLVLSGQPQTGNTDIPYLYEWTGLSGISSSKFNGWTDSTLPDFISAAGFSKADLIWSTGAVVTGGVYAKVYDFGVTDEIWITWDLIPWDQEPGLGYPVPDPVNNTMWYARSGSNDRVQNLGFQYTQPDLIYDGRDDFTPGPTEEQPFFRENIWNAYLSEYLGSPIFFIKEKSNKNKLNNESSTNFEFENIKYLSLDKKGTTKALVYNDPKNLTAVNDPSNIEVYQRGYRDWRWDLQASDEEFSLVQESLNAENPDGTFIGSPRFFGRSTCREVVLNILEPNIAFVSDFFTTIEAYSTLKTFLESGTESSTTVVVNYQEFETVFANGNTNYGIVFVNLFGTNLLNSNSSELIIYSAPKLRQATNATIMYITPLINLKLTKLFI